MWQKSPEISASEERRLRQKVLLNADVVCCTLNSSASSALTEALCLPDVPQGAGAAGDGQLRRNNFTCVIVDEACQSTELDCLVPLQYKVSKLVLVGDPEQLPATVLSKVSHRNSRSISNINRCSISFYSCDKHHVTIYTLGSCSSGSDFIARTRWLGI